MSCDEYQQEISKLLDNMLDKKETPGVFTHLGGCEECRDFFSSTVRIQRAMRAAATVSIPAQLDATVPAVLLGQEGYARDKAAAASTSVDASFRDRAASAMQHDAAPVPRRSPRKVYSRIGTALQLLIVTILLVFLFSIRVTSQGDNGQPTVQSIPIGQMSEMRLR